MLWVRLRRVRLEALGKYTDTKWKAECTDNIIYRNTDILYVQINRNSVTLDINER